MSNMFAWFRRTPDARSLPIQPSGTAGVYDRMQEALNEYAMPVRLEYDGHAREYHRLASSVATMVLEGAHVVRPSRPDEPGTHELIAWRLDADISDGRFDDAYRIRMLASAADSRRATPDGVLLQDALPVKDAVPAVREITRRGIFVHHLEMQSYPLVSVPKGDIVARTNARFDNRLPLLEGGHHWQTYQADSARPGTAVPQVLPILPRFEDIQNAGYARFCNARTADMPLLPVVLRELDAAAREDATGQQPVAGDLASYREYADQAGEDARERVRRLGAALYDRKPGAMLSPALGDALRHPDAALHAHMGLADRYVYVRHLGGRNYSPELRAQLGVVVRRATELQIELFPAMHADRQGYVAALADEMAPVLGAVNQAASMHAALAYPATFQPKEPDWLMRA